MPHPFPLFSLPYVPLKKVLDNFGQRGIIFLSLCSLRSKSIAVSYRGPSKDVRLTLDIGLWDCLEDSDESYMRTLLTVENIGNLPMNTTLETVRIGSFENVPVKMENNFLKGNHLITYWEDRMTGLAAIGDCAREVFNQDIYKVFIYDKREDDDLRRAAEWIKNSQKTIRNLCCNFNSKIDNDLDVILENFKCTEKLFLYVKPLEYYSPSRIPSFQLNRLDVCNSFWIKQNHLLTMDCKCILLKSSKLSSRDLNLFLKHWMAGGCSQLKELWISVEKPIDYQIVLDGVKFEERERHVERVFVDEAGTHDTIRGGFDIKRSSDNVKVTINNGNSRLFWMIVWPDFAGNSY
ncbi:hypothetical protein GCK72_003301 [Caenorhabditis remanei]|uniref:Sdz-33 F-box domain-containing protein n=1 Tax=Caenorhabditis remanei TaxID=31234 RepID=A0A6A5HV12_CAERE|nr:hypothetical protein GCK72_003301 [Caenorhabditis remanei]KAF1771475.1 hypothetical protein GCK72_003301 [Caenorhabditis remanei]